MIMIKKMELDIFSGTKGENILDIGNLINNMV